MDTADVMAETGLKEVFLATDLQVATATVAAIDRRYRSQVKVEARDRKALAAIFPLASRRELTAVGRNPMAEARA